MATSDDLYNRPREWFRKADLNMDNLLDKDECILALINSFSFLDEVTAGEITETLFCIFDPHNQGLSVNKFLESGGLYQTLVSHVEEMSAGSDLHSSQSSGGYSSSFEASSSSSKSYYTPMQAHSASSGSSKSQQPPAYSSKAGALPPHYPTVAPSSYNAANADAPPSYRAPPSYNAARSSSSEASPVPPPAYRAPKVAPPPSYGSVAAPQTLKPFQAASTSDDSYHPSLAPASYSQELSPAPPGYRPTSASAGQSAATAGPPSYNSSRTTTASAALGGAPSAASSKPISTNSAVGSTPAIPDIYTNSAKWFDHFDRDGSKTLDREECANGMIATFAGADPDQVVYILDALWDQFDPHQTGFITRSQFTKPNGLCDMIVAQFRPSATAGGAASASSKPLAKLAIHAPCPYDIFKQPREWFNFFDKDGSGSLDKQECIHGLAGTFPNLDVTQIESIIDAVWSQYDTNNTGYVTVSQFTRANGLCELITTQLKPDMSRGPGRKSQESSCPFDITTQPDQWFDFYDKDGSGALDKEECTRAFAATFAHVDAGQIDNIVDAIWDQYDKHNTGFVSRGQFSKANGLRDMIVSQLKPVSSFAPVASRSRNSADQPRAKPRLVTCPDIYTSPKEWFMFFDSNGSGDLDKQECISGFESTFTHVDREQIVDVVNAIWDQFVPRGGKLTLAQFIKREGLCACICDQFPNLRSNRPPSTKTPSPRADNFESSPRLSQKSPRGLFGSVGSFFGGGSPKNHQHRGNMRAVLIGINYYGTPAQLKSGVNDANMMKKLLVETYGWKDRDIRLLHDHTREKDIRPNKENILQALRWLVEDIGEDSFRFLHFSGHSFQEARLDGDLDEDDSDAGDDNGMSFTECIVPVDFKRAGFISDSFLDENLVQLIPTRAKLTVVMDCCRSGNGLGLAHAWSPVREWQTDPISNLHEGDVVMFSGGTDTDGRCNTDFQYSSQNGALTSAFCNYLKDHQVPTHAALIQNLQKQVRAKRTDWKVQMTSSQVFDVESDFRMNVPRANSNASVSAGAIPLVVRPVPSDPKLKELIGDAAFVVSGLD